LSINENETRKLLNFLIEKVPREIAITAASTTLGMDLFYIHLYEREN
jgi:hypothetical protein